MSRRVHPLLLRSLALLSLAACGGAKDDDTDQGGAEGTGDDGADTGGDSDRMKQWNKLLDDCAPKTTDRRTARDPK